MFVFNLPFGQWVQLGRCPSEDHGAQTETLLHLLPNHRQSAILIKMVITSFLCVHFYNTLTSKSNTQQNGIIKI